MARSRLPKGASWAIVPDDRGAAGQLEGLNPDRVAPIGRVFASEADAVAQRVSRGATVADSDPDAFAPDARGRAILRGLEYARADLRDAGDPTILSRCAA